MVLHHLTRGQLGEAVNADGTDKRASIKNSSRRSQILQTKYMPERSQMAGEKFTTVVQIGIGGSDLAREPCIWLWKTGQRKRYLQDEAKFISNVDPDDAAAVLYGIDVAHSIFILVSKSGTTLETLTNESFVKMP